MDIHRKNRLENLKKENYRRIFLKKLPKNIGNDCNFLSIGATKIISKKVYKIIDDSSYKKRLSKDYNESLSVLIEMKKKHSYLSTKKGILFHYKLIDLGALIITCNNFLDNIDELLAYTKFKSEQSDFILIGVNLEYGICIERYEYYNEFVCWGL
ncbi:hypothetical protein CEN49_24280 [Fischerella thermalis CCMEE 5273]|nr:hypothetical protein CEN49_24280 [Fischerella thermalis CCMEE 5273]